MGFAHFYYPGVNREKMMLQPRPQNPDLIYYIRLIGLSESVSGTLTWIGIDDISDAQKLFE